MRKNLVFVLCVILGLRAAAQEQLKVTAIGFYNCENFFDTIHDPNKMDYDFTPSGAYHYTSEVYKQKLHNIANVIQKMGTDVTPDGPAVMGLVEVENGNVLSDLVAQPAIAYRHYKYVWFYTSDERGISTALIYNPKYLQVLNSEAIRVPTETLKFKRPTRDILHVYGVLAGDTVHFLVNHWPSKSGGEAASEPGRLLVASIDKRIVDSLTEINPDTKIIIMGDLNDNPTSKGVVGVLKAKANIDDVEKKDIYNPWIKMYKKGFGTESYQGEWNLIDQIMLSGGFIKNHNDKWKFYKAEIFNKDFLVNKIGNNAGLPHRSFTIGNVWDNGYSDHFPVLVYLTEKK
jgi:endonuclease/exonuclease/phosphatase family metal-dependent hydrolase